MSIGQNHRVYKFTEASEALDSTQRLAILTRKNTALTIAANNGVKLESECVSVPRLEITDAQISSIRSAVIHMVEKYQDSLIRSLVDNGATSVCDSQIDFEAITAHIAVVNAGKRLRKEAILAWWQSSVYSQFRAYSEAKFGIIEGGLPATDIQTMKLEQTCNIWRDLFANVAGNKLLDEKKIAALKSVISKLELNDHMSLTIAAKLTAMEVERASANALLEEALSLDFTS